MMTLDQIEMKVRELKATRIGFGNYQLVLASAFTVIEGIIQHLRELEAKQ